MKECVGNVGHEFFGQTEHIQSTTKFLAQQEITFRAGAPVKMGQSSKEGLSIRPSEFILLDVRVLQLSVLRFSLIFWQTWIDSHLQSGGYYIITKLKIQYVYIAQAECI